METWIPKRYVEFVQLLQLERYFRSSKDQGSCTPTQQSALRRTEIYEPRLIDEGI